ncbi:MULTISPECIES: hypothetical protein [unclassified Nostoc]|nr:hypothetical protein [Nostoc sp. S13]MDF5737239.1 hypothetical protein [Nostoc sp. S13]
MNLDALCDRYDGLRLRTRIIPILQKKAKDLNRETQIKSEVS